MKRVNTSVWRKATTVQSEDILNQEISTDTRVIERYDTNWYKLERVISLAN